MSEQVCLPEHSWVSAPTNHSYAEAATLPCAGLTAWHALTRPAPVKPGETVLLLGTGGVSVFAQQFCNIMGARTIVTSSSDKKINRMWELGAGDAINYRTTPEWDVRVLELTDGIGVDRVIEVGGPGTLQRSINAVRVGGAISLIGVLTGGGGEIVPTSLMRKSISLRGIYVGSYDMFQEMNRAITAHELNPVVSETFAFENARAGYHRMRSAGHFGKMVIEVA